MTTNETTDTTEIEQVTDGEVLQFLKGPFTQYTLATLWEKGMGVSFNELRLNHSLLQALLKGVRQQKNWLLVGGFFLGIIAGIPFYYWINWRHPTYAEGIFIFSVAAFWVIFLQQFAFGVAGREVIVSSPHFQQFKSFLKDMKFLAKVLRLPLSFLEGKFSSGVNRAQIRECLADLAFEVLICKGEKDHTPESEERENHLRIYFESAFDMCKRFELIPEDHGYGPYYDIAKKRLEQK